MKEINDLLLALAKALIMGIVVLVSATVFAYLLIFIVAFLML